MFDKEKMFDSDVVIKIISKDEYDELKNWCDDEGISITGYPGMYRCIRFEDNDWGARHAEIEYYKKRGKTILSLDDIRMKEVDFDLIVFEENNVVHCETLEQHQNLKKWAKDNHDKWIADWYAKEDTYISLVSGGWGNVLTNSSNRNILKYEDVIIGQKLYTLEQIKNEDIAVHCDTKEKAMQFDKFTNRSDAPSETWTSYREHTCYELNSFDRWVFCDKNYYEEHNYTIISIDQITETKEENYKMKYKLIKELTGKAIVETACTGEFNLFVKKYGYTENVIWNEENEKFIVEQNGWITLFLDKGFIVKNEPKIVYNEKDIYVIKSYSTIYKLTRIDDSFMFCALSSTHCGYNGQFAEAQNAINDAQSVDVKVEVFKNYNDFKTWLKDN